MKLQNKVTIITGAGSGMGQAMALLFAKEGAKVVVSDINLENLNKVVTEITLDGGNSHRCNGKCGERARYSKYNRHGNRYIWHPRYPGK